MKTNSLSAQLKLFLGFIVFGIILSVVENLIAISLSTGYTLDTRMFLIAFMVAVPFAGITELVVDRINLLPQTNKKWLKRLEILLEFFVFGVIMGVIEDLVAVNLLTGEPITLRIVGIVALVTLPFAIIGEVIVDRHDWFPGLKTKSKRS